MKTLHLIGFHFKLHNDGVKSQVVEFKSELKAI